MPGCYRLDGFLYCTECGPVSGEFLEVVPKADRPEMCVVCADFLENELTEEGRRYVVECVRKNLYNDRFNMPRDVWAQFYKLTDEEIDDQALYK